VKKPGGAEYQYDYGIDKISDVIAKNFYLDGAGKIPSDVLLQVKAFERGRARTRKQR